MFGEGQDRKFQAGGTAEIKAGDLEAVRVLEGLQ